MYILRFYGSCGHITNEEISEENFLNWTKEIIVKTICGDVPHKNEVTVENNQYIVHVYPFRFFVCNECIIKDLKEILNYVKS